MEGRVAPAGSSGPPSVATTSARRVARNALVPVAAGMLGKLLDFGFALVYLRALRAEGTGAYQFLVVFITYLDTIVGFGLDTLVARDVARAPRLARLAFWRVLGLRLGLWAALFPVTFVVLGPALPATGLPAAAVPAGWLFYAGLLPAMLGSTASGLLWAAERMEVRAVVAVLSTLLRIGLGLGVLLAGLGLVGLAAASVVVNVAAAALLVSLAVRLGALPVARGQADAVHPGSFASSRALLREGWPLFVNQLLNGLFFKLDSLLLPGLAGARAAGVYASAYKVVEGQGIISSSLTLALFPQLARRAGGDAEPLALAYRVSLRTLLQVAVPLAAGTALLAEPIMGIVGGSDYMPEGAFALAALIWYLPFSFANGLMQYVLIAVGRQRFLTGAFLAAVVFNLSANLLLIPRFGYLGAAWTTVASEIVLLVPFHYAISRSVPGVSLWSEARAAVLAALLMAPPVWWLRDALHPGAGIVVGLLVYPLALWSVGGIDVQQWAILRALLPDRRAAGAPRTGTLVAATGAPRAEPTDPPTG